MASRFIYSCGCASCGDAFYPCNEHKRNACPCDSCGYVHGIHSVCITHQKLAKPSIYIIGSLRNPAIDQVADAIREIGLDAFEEWRSPGERADEHWRDYAVRRGWTYREAINSFHARNVFEFDKKHLDRCDAAVLVLPAGRSGHLELGYMSGLGKPTYILMDEPNPERYDIMYLFATKVCFSLDELLVELKQL